MPALDRTRAVVTAVVREIRAENITFMAGSIAYHAFVSMLPFMLLLLAVVSTVGNEQLARDLLAAVASYLTPQDVDLLVQTAFRATSEAGLSGVGLVVLVWGTLRIFRGLDTAFSDIYESHAANTFLDQLRDGIVVFGAVGLAIAAVSTADILLGFPSLGGLDTVLRPLATGLLIGVALLPMYYVFPDEDVTVREVVPGALVAGYGWTLLGLGFSYYVQLSQNAEYGVIGVVILLVTWLYFGGLFLLVGAAVNAVLAGRSEDVANIAWGVADARDNDAEFVAPLRDLGDDFPHGVPVEVTIGETTVMLPPPDEANVTVKTVDRPAILGGNRETGELLLRWDSWEE